MITIQWPMHGTDGEHCNCNPCSHDDSCICPKCLERRRKLEMSKNCSNCKWAVFEDFGYSNWTVEGTYFSCLKSLHPDGNFDRFYGEDKRLQFAENCPAFTEGQAVFIDVDREERKPGDPLSVAYANDPEQAEALDQWAK